VDNHYPSLPPAKGGQGAKAMQNRFVLYGMLILVVCGTRSTSATPPEMILTPTEEVGHHLSKPVGDLGAPLPYYCEDALQDNGTFDCNVIQRRSALSRWWHYRAKPHMQYSHWGYPEFFAERPLGSSVRAHECTQIAVGIRERLVLYRYDFHEDSTMLNRQGQQRLNDLAAAFPYWAPDRLVIEATPDDPLLAIARRNHVMHLLEVSDVSARVEVDEPRNRMVQGEEAILIHQHFLRQVQSGSPATQTGSGYRGTNMSRPPAPSSEGFR
jgi:hypothetical protein